MRFSPTGQYVVMERGQHASDLPRRIEVCEAATGAVVGTHPPGFNPRWLSDTWIVAESTDGQPMLDQLQAITVQYVPANRGQLDARQSTSAVSDLRTTRIDNDFFPSAFVGDARDPRLGGPFCAVRRPSTGQLRLVRVSSGTDAGPELGPCEDARWSSETLVWWLGGRVWGRTTPDQPTVELTVPGRACGHPAPLWTGSRLFVGLVLDEGELWVADWADLAARNGLGWRVGTSTGGGFDWCLQSDGGFLSVCYFDPLGKPVYADLVMTQPPESMLKPPHKERWKLVPDGTLVTDAFRVMFGAEPSLSADGKRICLHKNINEQEWRERRGGQADHLFDRSRYPGDIGWYLVGKDGQRPVFALDTFRSGESFSFVGELVEFATGKRVPWNHSVTLYGLTDGGTMVRFDPRFARRDYGVEKCYEHQFTSPTAGARWELLYSPEAARALPWGDRSLDVLKQEVESGPPVPGPTLPYIECPRLSVDADPWAKPPKPKEPTEMTAADAAALAVYPAPSDIVQGAMNVFRDNLLERDRIAPDLMTGGALRYFFQHYGPTMAAQQVLNGIPGNANGWGGYSITAVRAAMTAYDRDQKGSVTPPDPPVQPPATALVPLHIDGTTFRRPDGSVWKYRAVTAFSAFQDFLAGRDLTPYAAWTRSVGGNAWRIFYTWTVTGFNPLTQLGQPALARELANFRRFMDEQGLYSHNTVLCDQVNGSSVLLSTFNQDVLMDAVGAAMQGRLLEEMNEGWKNGSSGRFPAAYFEGAFGTRSSWQDGEDPRAAGSLLDFTTEHTPRDAEWPRKAKNMLETSTTAAFKTGKPAVGGEPIGIWEQDVPGSRTANTSDVADYYAVAELFSAGACLHGDGSTLQRCTLPGPNAQRCAEWAKAAREAIPADAQLGEYSRGGLDNCPIEHSDSTALRTFFMLNGNRGTGVVVRPVPGWEPRGRNGWRVDGVGGPNGHIVYVSR